MSKFATNLDALPEIVDSVPAAGMLISAGMLERAAVFGPLHLGTTIHLVGITMED